MMQEEPQRSSGYRLSRLAALIEDPEEQAGEETGLS